MWKGREEGGDKKKKIQSHNFALSRPIVQRSRSVPGSCTSADVCACSLLADHTPPVFSCMERSWAQLSASFSFTVTSMKTAFTCCGRAVDNIQSNTADARFAGRNWSAFFFFCYFSLFVFVLKCAPSEVIVFGIILTSSVSNLTVRCW